MEIKHAAWVPVGPVEVDPWDFVLASYLHGLSHTLRVMHHVLAIASQGRSARYAAEVVREAWCAAIVHDMARRHEGHCDLHGRWSVAERLPVWQERFRAWGVEHAGIERIAFAVELHCLPKSFADPHHPGSPVLHLLQDADALDRVRFSGWCDQDCMDPRRLHDPDVAALEPAAQAFFSRHAEVERWEEMRDEG